MAWNMGFLRPTKIITGDLVYQPTHSEDYLEIGDEERQNSMSNLDKILGTSNSTSYDTPYPIRKRSAGSSTSLTQNKSCF